MKKLIIEHQSIQAMTWEIKEVMYISTLQWKTKNQIIDAIKKVIVKHEDDTLICYNCQLPFSKDCDICNWNAFTV